MKEIDLILRDHDLKGKVKVPARRFSDPFNNACDGVSAFQLDYGGEEI